jgi:predicted chitinase
MKEKITDTALAMGFLKNQVAYILATVKHETNDTYQPVVESYWLKNPDEFNKKHHPEYYPYYGRGLVQITWEANYEKFGKLLNLPLVQHPELVLVPETAIQILLLGFRDGLFTGHKLSDFVNSKQTDFLNARKCINGTDKNILIAGYATQLM